MSTPPTAGAAASSSGARTSHAPLSLSRARPEDPRIRHAIHRPEGQPERAVLVTHGYNEHSGRYGEVVRRWTAKGLLVATYDLRGHGLSEGPRGRVELFDDYVRDADELLGALAKDEQWRACGKPILFGHSLGGLVSTHIALAGPKDAYRGLAMTSPFFELVKKVSALEMFAGKLMSRFAPSMGLPSGLKGEDVTHDVAIAKAYDADPFNFGKANSRFFFETLRAQDRAFARAAELSLPIFCLHAGDDRLTSPVASKRFVERTNSTSKVHRVLPGLFHEVLNEVERVPIIDELADVMLAW
ncbi:MAG: lysophospholipase [Deltaproteobacteria bacterium]|nr:lysophospholipase [Deltaproteobacteria bacterium]